MRIMQVLLSDDFHIDFIFGAHDCSWNLKPKSGKKKLYKIITKNPIDVLRSIMANDNTFRFDDPKQGRFKADIRGGDIFTHAHNEIRKIDPNGCLIGIMLAIDDTPLTQHSGTHNGRPVYITTANQSLASRRQRNTNAWRVLALLPVLKLDENNLSKEDKPWSVHAKVEFNNRALAIILKPLQGNQFYLCA